jgi:hypothetical protein
LSDGIVSCTTQYGLRQRLTALPDFKDAEKPVDVAILESIIRMVVEGGYREAARRATGLQQETIEYAFNEARSALIEQARRIARDLIKGNKVAVDQPSRATSRRRRRGIRVTGRPSLG